MTRTGRSVHLVRDFEAVPVHRCRFGKVIVHDDPNAILGGRFVYEFTLHQEGTYFYHSHMAMQEMIGMIGAFIMHPKELYKPAADKDLEIIVQEYAILPNIKVPDSMNMEFNWLTFNGKAGPATTPLIVRHGAVRAGIQAGRCPARITDPATARATRLRQLVASGMLRIRDPRITQASLASWCGKNYPVDPASTSSSSAFPPLPEGPCSWKRAAKILNIEVVDVQKLISTGQLKLADTFVTDRAFEEFCRKHGSAINMALIDASTRKWLVSELCCC